MKTKKRKRADLFRRRGEVSLQWMMAYLFSYMAVRGKFWGAGEWKMRRTVWGGGPGSDWKWRLWGRLQASWIPFFNLYGGSFW